MCGRGEGFACSPRKTLAFIPPLPPKPLGASHSLPSVKPPRGFPFRRFSASSTMALTWPLGG